MLTMKQAGRDAARFRHMGIRCLCAGLVCCSVTLHGQTNVSSWLTNADRSALVAPQPPTSVSQAKDLQGPTITVDEGRRFQTVDGFGFALTGGSAQLLQAMSAAKRKALLTEMLGDGPGQGGVSYLRVTIGASDMNDHVYTYDDLPAGATDPELRHFSMAEDQKAVIPVLREIVAIRPSIAIVASPWTAPSWMKTNDAAKGGKLKPEFYPVYAQYFVRYLKTMQAAGVPIAALTMQNEPLNDHNTPSMEMQAVKEQAFLRDALGPALRSAGLHPRVILWDHNCDHPDYPITILSDPKAAQYADGSGFHLYAGKVDAMSKVHDAFPAKHLYFTEQMVIEERNAQGVERPVADPISRVVIGAMRNWSRNVLLWNLAADAQNGPHTQDGGCSICQGAVTIEGDKVERNIAYYTIAQIARFVPPGSVRIASTESDATLANVAWRTPGGKRVLLITNTGPEDRTVTVRDGAERWTAMLPAGGAETFVW